MRSVIDGQVVSMEVDEPKGEGAQLASSLRFVRRRLGGIHFSVKWGYNSSRIVLII